MQSNSLVTINELAFTYGRGPRILHGINLHLQPGTVHCLLGGSGCGKTTLLRLLAGLERPTQGSIVVGGQTVSSADRWQKQVRPEHRAVGYVFQDYALFPHLSVLRNVTFGMNRRGRTQRRSDALDLLDRVGLADYADAMPHTLSGGQQQRVALARALARDPKLMLLDEPFTGLDTLLRDEVREVTLNVLRDAHVATLMVTHDPAEALLVADLVSVMKDGRLLLTAPPDEVCTIQPRHKGPSTVRLQLNDPAILI
ncbi:ABC transporter ATP-binding protein [Poriferisphaera sp. WC338]|uniref:ABC transporter ATP-binding protein n=1 Tax=Poriferisphaera sp. WC338 TaxID=3425129 RepID=UPI003D819D52